MGFIQWRLSVVAKFVGIFGEGLEIPLLAEFWDSLSGAWYEFAHDFSQVLFWVGSKPRYGGFWGKTFFIIWFSFLVQGWWRREAVAETLECIVNNRRVSVAFTRLVLASSLVKSADTKLGACGEVQILHSLSLSKSVWVEPKWGLASPSFYFFLFIFM